MAFGSQCWYKSAKLLYNHAGSYDFGIFWSSSGNMLTGNISWFPRAGKTEVFGNFSVIASTMALKIRGFY